MADISKVQWNSTTYNLKDGSAIANITRSGTTFTATRRDGTTFTFDQQAVSGSFLPLTGGTVTGTTLFSKTTAASGTANNSPALIVGGAATAAHMEMDFNKIMAKTNGTSVAELKLNPDGGQVSIGAGGLNVNGTITGTKVYNAVYNDYAELFKIDKNDPIENGKIAYACEDGYVHSQGDPYTAVGIVSDTFGHLLGGEGDMNDPNYVPIGLAGRVSVYAPGVKLGEFVAANDDGTGRSADLDKDKGCILGKCIGKDPKNREGYIYLLINIG